MNRTAIEGTDLTKSLRRYGFISSLAGPLAMLVGGLVLAGWLLGLSFLASVMPDFTTMKPNTAACLVLAGLSLWLLRLRSNQGVACNPAHRRFAQICALLVAFLGLLALGEHFLNLNLGLDQMLLRDTWTDVRLPPGRMSIPAASGLLALGFSLFFLGTKGSHGATAAQIFALISLVDAVLAFLGYVYGFHGLYGNADYNNKRWFDYTGTTIGQANDSDWKEVLHPDDLPKVIERWAEPLTTGSNYEAEYRLKRASDGVYRWHIGRAFAMRNPNGEIIQWVGTFTDIDDQKQGTTSWKSGLRNGRWNSLVQE